MTNRWTIRHIKPDKVITTGNWCSCGYFKATEKACRHLRELQHGSDKRQEVAGSESV